MKLAELSQLVLISVRNWNAKFYEASKLHIFCPHALRSGESQHQPQATTDIPKENRAHAKTPPYYLTGRLGCARETNPFCNYESACETI
jgi:hypothetical protein